MNTVDCFYGRLGYFLVLGMLFSGTAYAGVPDNASSNPYGGYRRMPSRTPPGKGRLRRHRDSRRMNPTDASYGAGWRCARGFRQNGEACVALDVPENAHADYSGNAWECDRPYRKYHDECRL